MDIGEIFLGIGDAQAYHDLYLFLYVAPVQFIAHQPLVSGHYGTGGCTLWIVHMVEVPVVRIFAPYPEQIGSGPLTAPKEWAVINKLPCLGIFPIAFYLTAEGAYPLGMAGHTSFPYIQVPAFEFKGGIWFYARNGGNVRFYCNSRDDLYNSPDGNGNSGQDGQLYGLA